jgi:WD40 repeat protein
LQRVVAVKIHRDGDRARFIREALLTGELDHPSIVPVLDFGALVGDAGEGSVAMAMKRLRGVPWDELLRREPDDLRRHGEILDSICRALSYAHSKGILHLDLKPGQVIVGEFGEVYLCDWGMAAKQFAPDGTIFVSTPSGPFGTPAYMAPEQAHGDLDAISLRTHIYLLGGLLYTVLCGYGPHPGDSTEALIGAARRNELRPLPPHAPPSLTALATEALSTDPEHRPPSSESFRLRLAEALRALSSEGESARLTAAAEQALKGVAEADYDALERLVQDLDRAIVLAPASPLPKQLRDQALAAHATLAIQRRDLALAAALRERLHDSKHRATVDGLLRDATEAQRARERQQIAARRSAFYALVALTVVLIGSSLFLYRAFRQVQSESQRAESALADARRELARASVQAAASLLDNHRPADARNALARVQPDQRGWEWSHLTRRAQLETVLYRPRTEHFTAMVAGGPQQLAALRTDGRLVLIDRTAANNVTEASGRWRALGSSEGAIATGSDDGTVARWENGEARWTTKAGSHPIVAVAPSRFGVIAVDDQRGLWVVDATESHLLMTLDSPITVLSSNERGLVLGMADGTLLHGADVRSLVSGNVAHDAPVAGVAWHPTLPRFVTWAIDGTEAQPTRDSRFLAHDLGIAAPIHHAPPSDFAITAIAWSPDGTHLMVASASVWIHELETTTWKLVRSRCHDLGIAYSLSYLAGGTHLLILGRTMAQVRELQWLGQDRVFQVDPQDVAGYHVDGMELLLAGASGGIGSFPLDRLNEASETVLQPDRLADLALARGAPFLVAAHRWGQATLWSTASDSPQRVSSFWTDGDVLRVALSDSAEQIILLTALNRLDWATRQGTVVTPQRHWILPSGATAVAMHPLGTNAVAGGEAGLFIVTQSLEPPRLTNPLPGITALAYQPDGSHVAAGTSSGSVHLLEATNLAGSQPFGILEGHGGAVTQLTFDATGRWLLSTSADGTARLWDLTTNRPAGVFQGTHSGPVHAAVLTPDGRRVLTGGADSILRVFERETGTELLTLPRHRYGITDLELLPNGNVLTTGFDTLLRTWRVTQGGQ